ncbi:hypothetical protein J2S74_001280 [Evansella vedderi]|uniref:WYL domain-containing protein n=1 Tax=Evansella vedderi TaxID=38282 RepID=A0ABT9ZRQ4_9BACI|nr:transcriptional regulator [Evansella vedderi]MDQ0253908.1 hypothetical protein [Evansella vedderi]
MEKFFQKAQFSGQPIMIMYLSQKGMVTKRLVSVEHINGDSILGFCHLRKAKRRFLLDNILAALPPTSIEIKEYMNVVTKSI